ncbi:MAG: UDP-N-acetylmuramoyl-L-alanyl-D-glutamate--2,6-diaminopimelate ligase [Verrucomicrobiae bacterium]|nr:UDP-N-acetylmuramoyl-L-alanyl-D-glutamate--2,6-diaminopimelate ligase [Verrucomicrobiae bacterium]
MKLKALIEGIQMDEIHGFADVEVAGIEVDSRQTRPGQVFVALKGVKTDGHQFIGEVVGKGVAAVICEQVVGQFPNVTQIRVADSHAALARLAANYYGHPSRRLKMAGITGTNGKTTTSFLLASIFDKAGFPAGVVGTLGCQIGERQLPALNTTPPAHRLQEWLAQMLHAGLKAAVMEVSSHSLVQRRVDEVAWDVAVFTNLTRDHLDYHRDMDEYFRAKRLLFERLEGTGKAAVAVFNFDDPRGAEIRAALGNGVKALSFGVARAADVQAELTPEAFGVAGSRFRLVAPQGSVEISTPLCGRHNVSNCLAAAAAGLGLGLDLQTVKQGLEAVQNVPGRLERVNGGKGKKGFSVFVDYAHTDDALCNVLNTLRPLTKGKLITVFGCGGDRDATKRPLMGKAASEFSDYCLVTTDNPRNEDPAAIVKQIEAGILKDRAYRVVLDRRQAIAEALAMAREGDVVLLAGKGHETYQESRGTRAPFDDRQVAREALAAINGGKN